MLQSIAFLPVSLDRTVDALCRLPSTSGSPYLVTNKIAWSRIHCLAFSRLPAAIKFEFDELLLSGFDELLLSLANVCEP